MVFLLFYLISTNYMFVYTYASLLEMLNKVGHNSNKKREDRAVNPVNPDNESMAQKLERDF